METVHGSMMHSVRYDKYGARMLLAAIPNWTSSLAHQVAYDAVAWLMADTVTNRADDMKQTNYLNFNERA
eukprot:scaffold1290_cov119-Skeletonema_marinoi.AAC.4